MRSVLLVLTSLIFSIPNGYGSDRLRLFVGEIQGQDQSVNELFRSQFVEELSKLKTVELVSRRDEAQFILSAVVSITGVPRREDGMRPSSTYPDNFKRPPYPGMDPGLVTEVVSASVSTMLSDSPAGTVILRITKAGNCWQKTCAVHDAVGATLGDIKKKLKWR
jgi:hypothetical protein